MLKHKLRLLIITAVALLIILLGLNYKSVPLTDRAFVLGLGMDYAEGKYELTAEILVAGQSAGGTGNEKGQKLVSGKGADAAQALNDIFEKTGKLPSLGHCAVLILGEGVYKREILRELEFFWESDAFRGNTPVVAAEGKAKELMQTKTALESFTSLSLFDIISVYGKNTNTAVTVLQDFRVKMLSPSASSSLTLVRAIPAPDAEASAEAGESGGEQKPLVFYDCSSVAAFRDGHFAGLLTADETEGLKLLKNQNSFDSFLTKNEDGNPVRVLIISKSVRTRLSLDGAPKADYDIAVKIKPAEAEDLNASEGFIKSADITESMRAEVKRQMTEKITAALTKSAAINSDFLYLGNSFYARFGKKWSAYSAANSDYLKKISFSVNIKIS